MSALGPSGAVWDLVVIGGGSGGIASARRAAAHGARVALVEGGRLGGTCVNVGCVPKKICWSAALVAEHIEQAAGYGFDVDVRSFDYARLVRARDEYVARLNGIYARNLEEAGVTRVEGWAELLGAGKVRIRGGSRGRGGPGEGVPDPGLRSPEMTLEARHVLIATGSRPRRPSVPGAELGMTSDDFFALTELPRRVAIVGGGYVAVELASILVALGCEVSLAFRRDRLLLGFDDLVRETLGKALERTGVRLVPGFEPAALERAGVAGMLLHARDGRSIGGVDALLWAVGRDPNVQGLGLEAAGVTTDAEGHVLVDEWQATSASGVFAVGDVTGKVPLTPVAIAAGRRLADRLFGGVADARLDYEDVPTVVFSHPPVGAVGLTEEMARSRHGDRVRVYTARFTNLHYAVTERKLPTAMKLVVVGEEERVVGVHVVGLGADELLQGFAVAVKLGARKRDLNATVAIHPTAAEELVLMR